MSTSGNLGATNNVSSLAVSIYNLNTGQPSSSTYLMFGGITTGLAGTATYNGSTVSLQLGTSYELDQLSDIQLTEFSGGRIYISYNDQLTSASSSNAWSPNFNNSSLDNYHTRWDKVEITYSTTNSHSGANLSATDFFSVPLAVCTFDTSNIQQDMLSWTAPSSSVFTNLGNLSGNNSQAVIKNGNETIRVISPSTTSDPGAYASFAPYISYVQTTPVTTPVQGVFNPTQSYDLTATIPASGQPNAGDLVMTGSVTGVTPTNTTIIIDSTNLPIGIYTANPPYTVNGNPANIGQNNVYAAAVRDVLSGFNFGFIGSSEPNPNKPGSTFGDGPSSAWYSPTKVPVSDSFGGAQPNNSNYYNQYAAYIAGVSAAYGFPFSDLIQSPFASLDPASIGEMQIIILPDSNMPSNPCQ